MGFALAELFVNIGADTRGAEAGIARVKGGLSKLAPQFEAIRNAAKTFLIAGVAGLGLAVNQAGDFGETLSKFEAVFKDQTDAAKAWSDSFASSVGRSKSEMMGFMASIQSVTVALGFSRSDAAKLSQTITALAVDLASFNNMTDADALAGLQSGILSGEAEPLKKFGVIVNDAALDAELLKMGIKGGSDAASEQQKVLARLNIVLKATKDAQGDALRTSGYFANQMKALRGSVMDLSVEIGQVFIPMLNSLIGKVRPMIVAFGAWAKANQQTIITMVKWAGAIAAAIVLGPTLIAFIQGAIAGFVGLTQVLLGVGSMLIWLVTSPIGLLIAGLAAAVTAIAYFAGSGDTASSRIIDGFMKIVEFLDHMLGSWEGFKLGISMIWDQTIAYLAGGLISMKAMMLNGWEHLAEAVEQVWWTSFEYMGKAWNYLQTGAMRFITWFGSAWETMTDNLGDLLYDSMAAVSDFFSGASDEQKAADKAYLDDMRKKDRGSKDAEYAEAQAAINAQYDAERKAIEEKAKLEREASRDKREANRKVNEDEERAAIAMNEQQRQADLKAQQEEFAKTPKLSDKLKDAYARLRSATGIDDMLKAAEDIKAELAKTKAEFTGPPDVSGIKGDKKADDGKKKKGKGKDFESQSLEQSFIDSISARAFSKASAEQQKKADEAEAKRLAKEAAEQRRAMLDLQKRQVEATEKTNELLKNPGGAVFA